MSIQQTNNNKLYINIMLMVAGAHLVNDLIQSMLTATYPLLEQKFALSLAQVGCITLVYQITASILQPAIGLYTDKHPKPYLLPLGMAATTLGLIMLALANSFPLLLVSAGLLGVGSSTFHPEGSRVARSASGGRFGLAQSTFQVGGNIGSSLGPLLVSLVVLHYNKQVYILWFVVIGLIGITLLSRISAWSTTHLKASIKRTPLDLTLPFSKQKTILALAILGILIFSKYFYMASITNYYSFYLIEKFHLENSTAVLFLFLFLSSVALGTFLGGPIGDRIGRKYVIWFSILGAAPFTLALPYANLFWTAVFSVCIGLILSSAFAAIVVYAQELIPGRVGMIAGLFFGFMFGMSGIAAAVLGYAADQTSLEYIFKFCSFLPLLGIITAFLPDVESSLNTAINHFKK
ncbi:MFS transporter [Gammaproteobacteria bacterium ESL0073]|uniref:MFS transporter n=1 Tax=Entomomonas moraniae TaxID=2213226 RepID=A0A3S9XEW3_9GAMM|nr:MFS transporter [Entomomonas moraniae]AWM79559.1 MFS transporter [Gammaproteobacteria bacterium ESL0073]AZS50816.1 MFS transporter [Entomomonas moraniae]